MNAVTEPLRFLINVEQYHRMGEAGIIPPDVRTELIEGEVLTMPPFGSRHAYAVAVLDELLRDPRIASRAFLWPQNPVMLSQSSEPQPDIVLLRRQGELYRDATPQPDAVLLLIEVSESSLPYDRQRKLPLYARHGIPEVWIVNLQERRLEVFVEPGERGYRTSSVHGAHESVAPGAFPDVPIAWGNALGS